MLQPRRSLESLVNQGSTVSSGLCSSLMVPVTRSWRSGHGRGLRAHRTDDDSLRRDESFRLRVGPDTTPLFLRRMVRSGRYSSCRGLISPSRPVGLFPSGEVRSGDTCPKLPRVEGQECVTATLVSVGEGCSEVTPGTGYARRHTVSSGTKGWRMRDGRKGDDGETMEK